MTVPWGDLLPAFMVLRERREWQIARPVLCLTVYLEDERRWAHEWAASLYTSFCQRADAAALRWVRTSTRDEWHSLEGAPEVAEGLRSSGGFRHQLRVRFVDRTGVPTVAFVYREVDSARSHRAGYLQLILPIWTNPDELLELALEVGNEYQSACMIGGPALIWNEELPRNGFRAIFNLCKRFSGLDVQVPEEASRFARSELPSVAWLTFLGEGLLARREISATDLGRSACLTAGASLLKLRSGLLLRAGDRPELGDVNAMEDPTVLRAVTTSLQRLLVKDGLHFPGPFHEPASPDDEPQELTRAWRERLLHAERW